MTKISARIVLAALLALQPVVQAAELAPVDILLTRAIPQDEAALATSGPEKGERLVILQSDLALVVEGLEGFASEADAGPSLKRLQESVDAPEQFKDRAAALDAVYRALAVVDYTWATRLPDAPCSPDASRAALLKSGPLSSWIASLLGVDGDAAAALDRASAATKASAREYALLRAKVRRLSDALGSEKAVGAVRASLYCRRAGAYEALSAANRSSGLTAASRATGNEDVTGVYVLARPSTTGWEILGAATSVEGTIVTDARLVESEGLALLRHDEKKPIPVTVERRDSGLALLRAAEPVKGLTLAETAPAKDDLIEALGHPERTGAWTRTRGLVTSADERSFQSDAVVDVGMAGGAALTEDGKLAGVFVLRRARSGADAFDWPVGVSAPALRNWLAGGTLTDSSGPVEIAEAGTASILTASRPMGVSAPVGAEAVQVSHHVFYQDGIRAVCMANCDDPAPAPAPRARSRTRYTNPRSSYGGSNANAELGKALGEAIAPLVEAMIFKGIPALFRGIGSLFKKSPKASPKPESDVVRKESKSEPPRPKEPLRITGVNLSIDRDEALEDEPVVLIAELQFTGEEGSKAGHSVDFSNGLPKETVFLQGPSSLSDSNGFALARFTIKRQESSEVFDDLKDEERRNAGEKVAAPLYAEQSSSAKGAERAKGNARRAFGDLISEGMAEEADVFDSDSSAIEAGFSVGGFEPGVRWSGNVVARVAGLKDEKGFKLLTGRCPQGTQLQEVDPESVSPGEPAKGDIAEKLKSAECRDIAKKVAGACSATNPDCIEASRREAGYYAMGCEHIVRDEPHRGNPPSWLPKSPRPKARYQCVDANAAKARTGSMGGTSYNKKDEDSGIVAANGLKITGFTKHGVDRAIGDLFRRMGVAAKDILDALKNPLQIGPVVVDKQGLPSQRFVGVKGEVVVNPSTGKIISVNPTSSNKSGKLSR